MIPSAYLRILARNEAQQLHQQLPHILGAAPPFDILALCKHFGIEAFAYPFPPSLDGCLIRDGEYYAIGVNSKHSRARRRFSAAHELYHFLNHRWKMPDIGCMMSPGEDDQDEQQASMFAAELLMPEDRVTRAWVNCRNAKMIAEYFGVSVSATAKRLQELGVARRRG